MGAILLETIPKVVFQLGQQLNSIEANANLANLQYINYLATATGRTLDVVAQNMFSPIQGHRNNAQPIVVAMLASESQESVAIVNASAMNLRNSGAHVIVIENGVDGNALFLEEALMIASQPSDIFALDTLEAAWSQGQGIFEAEFMDEYFCAPVSSSASTILPTPSPSSSASIAQHFTSTSVGVVTTSTPAIMSTFPTSSFAPPPPTPTPVTYCNFLTTDVIFVISSSGDTGADVFNRFVTLAENIINLLPAGSGAVRYD